MKNTAISDQLSAFSKYRKIEKLMADR